MRVAYPLCRMADNTGSGCEHIQGTQRFRVPVATSTFSPSHYGEVLPYRLPNTSVLGSISCKFFARPNAAMVDDKCMTPDVKVNLDDKDAAWKYIIDNYGRKMKIV